MTRCLPTRCLPICLAYFVLIPVPGWADESVRFADAIAPLLVQKCLGCHDEESAEGGYRVDSFSQLMRPGDSEVPPILPGRPEGSELLARLTTSDEDLRMPFEGVPLSDEAIRQVRQWIQQGAEFDGPNPLVPIASVVSRATHPDPPAEYRFAIPITAITFDDQSILVAGYHELLRCNFQSGRLIQRIPKLPQRIYALESTSDGRLLVGGGTPGSYGEVCLLDRETGEAIQVPVVTSDVILDVALNSKFPVLAAAGADQQIHYRNLDDGWTSINRSHSDWVHAIAWSSDGSRLASASRDKTTKIHDFRAERLVTNFAEHGDAVVDVFFLPENDDHVLSCDERGRVMRWNSHDGEPVSKGPNQDRTAYGMLSMSVGYWLSLESGRVRLFDWNSDRLTLDLPSTSGNVLCLAYHPRRRLLALGTSTGRVRIWGLDEQQWVADFVPFPIVDATP